MTGLEQLTDVRLSGIKPLAAFLFDHESDELPVLEQIANDAPPAIVVVGVEPGRADLRCLMGMRVHLVCDDHSRALRWVDALLLAGVEHVIQSTAGEVYQWRK